MDGGFRGATFLGEGVITGVGITGLAIAENAFRSFNDGLFHTLTDTLGVIWTNVVFDQYQPIGRVKTSPAGVCFRQYRCRMHQA